MNFSFTDEEDLFRISTRDFCQKVIAPRAHEIDDKAKIPREVISAMASEGLLGITISREHGGSSASFTKAAIAAEEIAKADMSMAAAVYYLVEAGWGFIIDRYGTKRAKEEILPEMTAGEAFLGIASTEATGGSDIASTSTTLKKKDGKFVLNGLKTYISGVREAASQGGGFVTVVRTEQASAHSGLSLCYLPVKDIEGVTISTLRQMGREGISNGFIRVKDAQVPEYYLIGEWNKGFYYAMEGFNCARTLVAAACIGAAEQALELGTEFIKQRKVFSSPLAGFEGIQFQLAEAYMRLESARLLVHKAAWMIDQMYSENRFGHHEINKAVAAAKFTAPQAAFDVIKDVMMWHGARGYAKETGLERGLRGVASYLVGAEGTQNIMKVIISKEILGKDYSQTDT